MAFSTDRLKTRALELGFNMIGIIPAAPSPMLEAYLRWIDAEMHGKMGYLARPDRIARRRDLNVILPGVQSMIVVGLDYGAVIPPEILENPSRGRIATYAWGLDYHDVMTPRLDQLAAWLKAEANLDFQHRAYVDTGAILERSHAQQAGLGFVGKNTMLIHPRRGSTFFLGEILTDLEFDAYDTPHRTTMCGSCTRCLTACPTNAFPRPYVLDSRRCISYLTIEYKDWIDPTLRPLMGNWIYGCDVCQDVCPWQRFSHPTQEIDFLLADVERAAPPLVEILMLDEAAFQARFAGSAITRIGHNRIVRNACIAAGNWGDEIIIPALIQLLDASSPLVRGHAAWALGRILTTQARAALHRRLVEEDDAQVQEEIRQALTL